MVRPARDISDPFLIYQIPIHSLAERGFETYAWPPAKFATDFAGIDGVAQVVSWPILYERNLLRVGLPIMAGPFLIKDGTDLPDELDIWFFARCADIVGFANPTV